MLFRDRDGVLVDLIEFGNPRPEWSSPASEWRSWGVNVSLPV